MNELLGNVYFWTFLAFAIGTLGWIYTQLKNNIENSAKQTQSIESLARGIKAQAEVARNQSDDIKKLTQQTQSIDTLAKSLKAQSDDIKTQSADIKKVFEMANSQDKALSEVRIDSEQNKKDISELDNILKTDIKQFIDSGKQVVAEFRNKMNQIEKDEIDKKEISAKQERKLEDFSKNMYKLNSHATHTDAEIGDLRRDMDAMRELPTQYKMIFGQLEKIIDRIDISIQQTNDTKVEMAALSARMDGLENKQPRTRSK